MTICAPRVMVSSTFFDLRQVRAHLASFLADELGYVPMLSEMQSFPIDPDVDTIENCRRRVEKDASILVLIIGGRYGTIDDKTDKSITNLEYLAARQKGIPIYVFVDKSVLAILPTWERSPEADFSAAVDTTRVFEFVKRIQSHERVWVFPFELARDISDTLRKQFAFLFNEALTLRLRLGGKGYPDYLEALGPRSLRIALEKAPYWEYRLLFQTWIDEVSRRLDSVREYTKGLTLEPAAYVEADNAISWIQTRMHELERLVESANKLLNIHAREAIAPVGVSGDEFAIIWVARSLGRILDAMLNWAQRIRSARLETPFERLPMELALFVDQLVDQFQAFPRESLATIESTMVDTHAHHPQVITLTMTFELRNLEGFQGAMDEAVARL